MREAGGRESNNFRNLGVGLRAGIEGTEKYRGNGEWEGGGSPKILGLGEPQRCGRKLADCHPLMWGGM